MENHLLKGKPWRAQAFVVLALLGACLTFFLVYVPNKKASFIEHNLRILGDMGDQIEAAIISLDTSITNASARARDDTNNRQHDSQAKGTNAPPSSAKDNDSQTSAAILTGRIPFSQRAPPKQLTAFGELSNSIHQIEAPLAITETSPQYVPGDYSCANVSIKPVFNGSHLILQYGEPPTNGFTVEVDLTKLFSSIVSRPEFKDVLLVDSQGRVQFQRSQTESRATNYAAGPDLLITCLPLFGGASETNSFTHSASVGETVVAGDVFKIFSRPLLIPLGTNDTRQSWILCGLVPGKDFTLATWKMPQSTILVVVFLAVGALLLLPFLNVALAGPLAALRRSDVVLVLTASVCLCLALAFGWFSLYAHLSSEENLDGQVGALCSNVCSNVKYELIQADALLTSLDADLFTNAWKADSFEDPTVWKDIKEVGGIFCHVPALFSNVPFSDVSWVNSNGMQVAKWTPSLPIGLVDVKDRAYFQSLRQWWAWNAYEVFEGPSNNFVYLDSIFSKTRNENTAILSHRSQYPGEWPTNSLRDANYFPRPIVSTITFQPSSLFNVILPRGYGFCLLDTSGRVLFHSDTGRNLRENFVVEAGHSRRLLSDIRSRTAEEFDCEYLNQPYHLAVRPMAGTTLTAVAFRNEDILGKLSGNILLNAVSLLLVYGLMLLVVLGFVLLAIRIWKPQVKLGFFWLWPERRSEVRYASCLLVATPLAIACFIGVLYSLSPNWLIGWAGLGPLIILSLSWWLPWLFKNKKDVTDPPMGKLEKYLNGRLRAGPMMQIRDGEIGNRAAHLLWLGLGLFLLAFVPAVACYKLAFGKESELLIRGTQLQLARDIQQRRVSIRVHEPRYASGPQGSEYWRYALERHLTSSLSHYETNAWKTWAGASSVGAPDDFGEGAAGRRDSGWFADFYQKRRWPLDEAGFRSSGLLSTNASDSSWRSDFRNNTLSLLVQGGDDYKRPGSLLVQSEFPQIGWMTSHGMPTIDWDWHALSYVALLLAVAIPFTLAWFIGKRVLLLEVSRTYPPCSENFLTAWYHCSPAERLMLHEILETGFAPSDRQEVKTLMEKGLLTFKPELSLALGFDKVVRQNFSFTEVQKSLGTEEISAPSWFTLRTALGITITAVAIFLFITQQEIWHLAVGFAGAFATAAQEFSKVQSVFRKDKSKTEGA